MTLTTDAVLDGSRTELMRASPSPDDIIAVFLEQQDDIVMDGQSQEYYSMPVNSFPSPSSDEDSHGHQAQVFSRNNAYTGARLSPSPRPLAGIQQDSQLPSPPESRSGSPSGSDKTAPRHRRTFSYPRKTGRHSGTHVRRHTMMGTSSMGHTAYTPVVPRKAEDWEPWKNVIHQLYIVQNRILKDIIVIMQDAYRFKATPKMYKNQFARWKFFKYAIKRRSRSGADTCSGSDSPKNTGESWMADQDHQPEEKQAGAAVFRIDYDSPVDAYPSHYLEDSPSVSQKPSYRLQSPQDELVAFCLGSESSLLAQQIIMNDPESKELGTQWTKGDFGPDFARCLEGLYDKITAMTGLGQFSDEVPNSIRNIYCGWMSDYYKSTQQWSEVFEWKKRGLSMTSNQQYVACSMRLEELMRDHGSPEEAEELRRARMNIGWLPKVMSGVLPSFSEWHPPRSTRV